MNIRLAKKVLQGPAEEESPSLLPATEPMSTARKRLYEAAIKLFGKRGYHGVSVKDLTDDLGIKPPSLYAHVASKQELLFELTLLGIKTHSNAIAEAFRASLPYPTAQVRALVHAHVLIHLTYPDLARIINTEARHLDPQHSVKIHKVRDNTDKIMKDVVDRGIALGEFEITNASRMLRLLADLGVHTAEWPKRPDVSEHNEIANDYAEIALRLMCPRR